MTDHRRIVRGSPGYPAALDYIADPPAQLWVRGVLGEEPSVAVVGTRRATRYGMNLAREMGMALARAGWTVVSGLARGIDGAAHRGCVEAGGRGVAVLGCGVDIWYPREHRQLGETLLAGGGAVISEYPPGTHPEPWRFPARNRIISGLSAVVVVVEAAAKGGALITARLAAEQGREVFAVPGDVDRKTSVGTNLLIRDGALPVFGAADLVEAASLVLGPPAATLAGGSSSEIDLDLPRNGASVEEVIEANGGDPVAVLRRLGRLEAQGHLRIEADEVFRA